MKKLYALFTFLVGIISIVHSQQSNSWNLYSIANSGIGNTTINAILVDNSNRKWFATDNGISTYSNFTWAQPLTNNSVKSLAMDSAGNIWAGLKAGLMKFDVSGASTLYSPNKNLPAFVAAAIAVDAGNNIWIATEGGGIVKNAHGNAVLYNSKNSALPSDIATAIEVDKNNVIWAGTELAGLASFDENRWTVYNTSNSALPDNNITAIAVDQNNNKWIGTGNGGLAKFDGNTFTVYNPGNSGIPSVNISAVEIHPNGDVWVGTTVGGAAVFNGSAWTVYNEMNTVAGFSNAITSLAFDHANTKWFGTETAGGLRMCHPTSVTITSQQLSACQGNAVTLSASLPDAGSHQWAQNGNVIPDATSPTYNATSNASYSVVIRDSIGCSSNAPAVNVILHPLPPAPTISQSGAVLASSAASGNQWSLNGNPIAGATNQFYSPTQQGFYTVSVTDTNGCTSSSSPLSFQPTGIEDKKDEPLSAKVFPNPSDGKFSVQLSNSDVKITSLTLNDILGNVVWRDNVSDKNNNEIEVDITGMTPGVYFLNINTTGRTFTKKISIR